MGGPFTVKACEFLKSAGTYYLATGEGDQPRVRPFGTAHIFEGKLYIQTGKSKPASRQIAANPKCEICACKDGVWLRVAAELVEDDRVEAKKSMLDDCTDLRGMYDEHDENTQVLYLFAGKYHFCDIQSQVYSVFDMLYQGYAEQRKAYLQKHKRISEYDSENLMYSVIQEVLSEEALSSIGCAVHVSLATLVRDYEPMTEEERKYARNPLTHVDFLLFNQMDKQPVLAIEVDGIGIHEAGSKQAERDMKKNSVLEKCAVPLLRLRTDGGGEKEKIRTALKIC